MARRLPRFTQVKRVKGHVYIYFRRGNFYQRIDAHPNSSAFAQRYAELLATSSPTRSTLTEGTLGWLMASFKGSPRFKALAEHTQWTYAKHFDRMASLSHFRVDEIKRRHVRAMRDQLGHQPRTADAFVTACGSLFKHAIDLDLIEINPAHNISRLANSQAYRAWPDEAVARFEEAGRRDVLPRWALTAFMVGRFVGGRRANVLRLGWAHYDGIRIAYQPVKGGEAVDMPAPALLKHHLDALPRDNSLFVVTPSGRPWDPRNFSRAFRKILNSLGLTDLSFHGLRYTVASDLAERGASTEQIRAITGHRTSEMAERYARQARQRSLADGAVRLMEGTGTDHETGKPPTSGGKLPPA